MRRIYFLDQKQESERVLDAILAQGLDPNWIENPTCPLCGTHTLLAYREDDEFTVVLWERLDEDEEGVDAWYLVCQELGCPYEEQVERTFEPEGALFFELQEAVWQFGQEVGIYQNAPADQMEMITWLRQVVEEFPSRRNQDLLAKAERHYRNRLKRIRHWVGKRQNGERIGLHVNGAWHDGVFFAATDHAVMMLTRPGGELVVMPMEKIGSHRLPVRDEEPISLEDALADQDSWTTGVGYTEYVVIRGHRVVLERADRFGLFHVHCCEAPVAEALNLTQKGENYWEGTFRRHEIEQRYEARCVVKVKGHWVQATGETVVTRSPLVSTEDPVVAEALGLKESLRWYIYHEEPPHLTPRRWSGIIPRDQVEAFDEVRVYLWPIPEAHVSGSDEERQGEGG